MAPDTIIGGGDARTAPAREVLDIYDPGLGPGRDGHLHRQRGRRGGVSPAHRRLISEFSEIEVMDGTNEADSIDAGVTTDGVEVYSNWGDDTVSGRVPGRTRSICRVSATDTLSGGEGGDLSWPAKEGDGHPFGWGRERFTIDGGADDDLVPRAGIGD